MAPPPPAADAGEPQDSHTGRQDNPVRVVARPRSHWRRTVAIVGLTTLVGTSAVAAATSAQGPSYTSESQVLWDPSATQFLGLTPADDPNSLERQVTDQRDVILSDPIIQAAGDVVGLEDTEIRDALTVDVATGSSTLTISASADDATTATAITSAITNAYRDAARRAGAEALEQQAAVLQPSIDRLRGDYERLLGELNAITGQLRTLNVNTAAYGAAQAQATQVSTQLADASTRLADLTGQQESLRAGAGVYPGQAVVLREASEPTAPSSLSLPTSAALGAALGFLVGVCIVVLLRRRPNTAQAATTG